MSDASALPDPGKVILVVEDDVAVREALCEVLVDHGYRTLEASNGREALDRLQAAGEKPDLILLDMMMPILDGWGFRAVQRSDDRLRDIPVLVLTAHATFQRDSDEMAVAGFLAKPVKLELLLDTIRRFAG